MCGISGVSFNGGHDAQRIRAAVECMVRAMRHRGPDDSDIAVLPPYSAAPVLPPEVVLGSTRLAILDLSAAGHQPMSDPETGNVLVLNGEIYNHVDLRREIGDRAGPWRSTGDTETVLKAYALWGESSIHKLRGMFALALWDANGRQLLCARDRLGIKPFYFAEREGKFAFASEVSALISSGLVERSLDEAGLAGYLKFGSLPDPVTLFEAVRSLPAGELMNVQHGQIIRRSRYWAVANFVPVANAPEPSRLRNELERAVSEHLLSDVPVATFLSGGMDSSVVTALAARHSANPIRTFTVCFDQPEFDESQHARVLAKRYNTVHQEVRLSTAEVLEAIPQAMEALDLPSADGLNTYIVSQAVARAGIKVVLSGLGGDELFGGYSSFRLLPRFERYAGVLGRFPAEMRRYGAGGRSEQITRRDVTFQYRYETMRAFWSDEEVREFGVTENAGFAAIDPGEQFSLAARAGGCEMQGYMRSTLLRDSDCMSMAHSLELRVPLLDHELVEYCLRHNAAGPGRKQALIHATADLLSRDAAVRPKQGFVLPMDAWIRGPLRKYVNNGLEAAVQSAMLNFNPQRLMKDFEQRRINYSRVWQLVVLGHWLERHSLVRRNCGAQSVSGF